MRILYKKENNLFLIGTPEEKVLVGDSIDSNGIVSQVLDLQYADLPGIMEHILRQSLIPKENVSKEILPDVKRMLETLTDQKLIITKIRGHFKNNSIERGISFFDVSREKTIPKIVEQSDLFQTLKINSKDTNLAKSISSSDPQNFSIDPNLLGISLITGQKGYGKSFFAKKLLLRLIDSNIGVVIFDPNNEYSGLGLQSDGNRNNYFEKIITLDPDAEENNPTERIFQFRINLSDISAEQFCNLFNIDLESPTAGEVIRYWNQQRGQIFTLANFEQWITNQNMNDRIQTALISRCSQAEDSNLFGPSNLRDTIQKIATDGGGIILNMRTVSPHFKPHLVNTLLSNVKTIAQNNLPVTLFLEESQLYVEKDSTYQDLLTRMRHIGLKPVFITNDPRTLPEQVLNLADNVFAFGFESEFVINHLAHSGKTDVDTFKTIKNLKKRQCLAIGDLTNGFPLFLEVQDEPETQMGGETRTFEV